MRGSQSFWGNWFYELGAFDAVQHELRFGRGGWQVRQCRASAGPGQCRADPRPHARTHAQRRTHMAITARSRGPRYHELA